MIEKFDDIGLEKDDLQEVIEKKVQEKLGLNFNDMYISLANYINDNVNDIVKDMINVAPHGDYEKLIEDTDGMVEFLKAEVVKGENWRLDMVKTIQDQVLQFRFLSTAVDDGETFMGFVVVSFAGKIKHAFCKGEC